KAYDVTLEQINWRRWCIREQCGRDTDQFKQEYPSNDIECFLLSGRGVFDGKMLTHMQQAVIDPPFRGELVPDDSKVLRCRLQENIFGPLRIWKAPNLKRKYVIGGDTAQGVAGGDFSAAAVHDWETFELVASLHNRIDPDLYADQLNLLGRLFNNALIANEDNPGGHGNTVNRRLLNVHHYPHLYYRQEIDDRVKRRIQKLGW